VSYVEFQSSLSRETKNLSASILKEKGGGGEEEEEKERRR
jgi:hypothetical protein